MLPVASQADVQISIAAADDLIDLGGQNEQIPIEEEQQAAAENDQPIPIIDDDNEDDIAIDAEVDADADPIPMNDEEGEE